MSENFKRENREITKACDDVSERSENATGGISNVNVRDSDSRFVAAQESAPQNLQPQIGPVSPCSIRRSLDETVASPKRR